MDEAFGLGTVISAVSVLARYAVKGVQAHLISSGVAAGVTIIAVAVLCDRVKRLAFRAGDGG